jgi:small nuclear ribonucleoprotein D3
MSGNINTGKGWLTVPVIFFHEGEGLTISVETRDGTLYRGRAERTEDNFSVSLSAVTVTSPQGVVSTLQRVYIRGSRIVFVVFPDVLKESPIFARVRRASEGKVVAGGLGAARQMAIQNKRA